MKLAHIPSLFKKLDTDQIVIILNLMVEYRSETLSDAFLALSDPTRRAILDRLRRGSARVTEIAEPFDVSLNAISKHLKILERAGLIQRRISGRNHECSLNAEPLQIASAWLDTYEKFWEERLDALENHLVRKRKKNQRRTK